MASSAAAAPTALVFTRYQKLVIAMLAFLQFAVIIDFMLMAPLGALIMPDLNATTGQFGTVVSAYAFAAGAAGFLAAGFADRFDRKKLLLFFYTGFLIGTAWCGLAASFESLLAARIVTGLFGGVIGSVVLAIATDLFAPEQRGRVMGFVQTAFAASQILGIPIGIWLSTSWNWHVPFLSLAALGVVVGLVIALVMRPVNAHLTLRQERSPMAHLFHTLVEPRHALSFLAMLFLATGGFMLMPFSSAFTVYNLGIDLGHLPVIYLFTGIAMIFFGPLAGKLTDAYGRLPIFLTGTTIMAVMTVIYTHLDHSTLLVITLINVVLFAGIFSRMIPFQTLMTQVPAATHRGSFNAVSSSLSQLAGGVAAVVAGYIVTEGADGRLQHYEVAGYVVVATGILASFLVWKIDRDVRGAAAVQAREGLASPASPR
jgi:predicted MFS family arabinose efflux permease